MQGTAGHIHRAKSPEVQLSTPLEKWVDESARLTKPSKIVWCDGSQAENERLVDQMLRDGTYIELNQKTRPNCYLHRSNPNDVARTEQSTFICTPHERLAAPSRPLSARPRSELPPESWPWSAMR